MPTPVGRKRLVLGVCAAVLLVALLGTALGLALGRGNAKMTSDSNPIELGNRAVPNRIATIPLVNESGHTTSLAALRGRIVVLADFMTSCQEECPITTGALLSVNQALASAHFLGKVTIVEASVDPWRDTPSRLLAYSKTFGVPWTLLTGSNTSLASLWSWFGVYYQQVKEGTPPDTNWQTGKPYTFDIVHSDDVFVLGRSGNVRALVDGNANISGKLPKSLSGLLSQEGRQELAHPGLGSWTPPEMLQAIGSALGQRI